MARQTKDLRTAAWKLSDFYMRVQNQEQKQELAAISSPLPSQEGVHSPKCVECRDFSVGYRQHLL